MFISFYVIYTPSLDTYIFNNGIDSNSYTHPRTLSASHNSLGLVLGIQMTSVNDYLINFIASLVSAFENIFALIESYLSDV